MSLAKVGDGMVDYVGNLADKNEKFETKQLFTLFGVDVVASTGFGFEANAFKDPNSMFKDQVRLEYQLLTTPLQKKIIRSNLTTN